MINQTLFENLRDFLLPIISILTFILSLITLSASGITNRRRLIFSRITRFARYSEIKLAHNKPNCDLKGNLITFDILNPSPHDIGINNIEFYNENNELLYIETGIQFQHVFLDNLIESNVNQTKEYIIKSNSQKRLSFLLMDNEYNNLPLSEITVKFNGIFTNWSHVVRHPIKHFKNPALSLKTFTLKQDVSHEIGINRR